MNSITKDYLVQIIAKKLGETIDVHRRFTKTQFSYAYYATPTDEELLDFIIAIPYFDDRLKDFLIGNLAETTIIISQSWENEFIIKTKLWSESADWLQGDETFPGSRHPDRQGVSQFLSLPY